jgi:hypothetical protein
MAPSVPVLHEMLTGGKLQWPLQALEVRHALLSSALKLKVWPKQKLLL